MVSIFLSHSYKRFMRSVAFSKDLVTGIFIGFFALMMVAYSLILGFAMDGLLTKTLQQTDSLLFINQLLLYYYVFEFVARYMMQNVPALDVQPYLHLPIKRTSIAHFLLSKSLLHVFNCLVLLLFTPFAFTVVASRWGMTHAVAWLVSLTLLSWCIHYLVILYKKKLDDSLWGIIALVGGFGLLGTADYVQWFKLSDVSAMIFNQPSFLVVAAIILMVLFYRVNFSLIVDGMYAEEWSSKKDTATEWGKSSDWQFLRGFGTYGEWISLELKLILRNKRPRSFILISCILLLYGLMFYRQGGAFEKMPGFGIFTATLMTSVFMVNYGCLMLSWQASHFDFTLTRPISLRKFIESKYLLLSASALVSFVLCLPYIYFGWIVFWMQVSMLFFNIGINVFIVMNLSMWDPQKIDLKKSSLMNYEGMGTAQWIMALPVMLAPYLVYLPFKFMFSTYVGIAAVGVMGLLGIVFRSYLIELTTQRFAEKKYVIAAGFRKE